MKKHLLLAVAIPLLIGGSAQAQQARKKVFGSTLLTTSPSDEGIAHPIDRDDDRDVIWSEDFGGGFPAGWTIQDPSGICPWHWTNHGATGYFANATHGTPPGVSIASTTATNGFLINDVDSSNTAAHGPNSGALYQTIAASFTTSAIDLTGHPSVRLEFEQLYRFIDAVTLNVEVSTDQTNWTSFSVTGSGTSNQISANPDLAQANISSVAGGQSTVYIRIGWSTRAYFWQIDDMRIVDAPDNDLSLFKGFYSNVGVGFDERLIGNLEYTLRPLEQVVPMTFAGVVTNNGSVAQNNVVLTALVDGNTFTSDPYPSLASGATDTIYILDSFEPTAAGSYTVDLSVASDDPNDANATDNVRSRTFGISDCENHSSSWALDARSLSGRILLSLDTTLTPYNEMGGKFEVNNPNSVAFGIGVVLQNETSVGMQISAELIADTAGGGATLSTAAVTDVLEVTADMLNATGGNHVTFIPFDAVASDPLPIPAPLDPAKDYEAFVLNNSVDTLAVGTSGTVLPGGLWLFDQTSANPAFTQFIGQGNPAPMVRLFLADPAVCVDGISELNGRTANATLGPNMPNPFNGYTCINYSLSVAGTVTLDIFDMTGHLTMTKPQGKKAAGSYMVDLDGTPLAQGVYTYTLTVDGERLTRRMVVTK